MTMQHGQTTVLVLATLLVPLLIGLSRTDHRPRDTQPPEQARQIYRTARYLLNRVETRRTTMTSEEAEKWQPLVDECLLDVERLEAEFPSLKEDHPQSCATGEVIK